MSSVVAVHGPTAWGPLGVSSVETMHMKATGNPTNGLQWTFEAKAKTRPVDDYAWSFPGANPNTVNATHGPITVNYASPGPRTATMTVSGVTGQPGPGAYSLTVNTVAGPLALTGYETEGGGDSPSPPPSGVTQIESGFDPAQYTSYEVMIYANANHNQVQSILTQELAADEPRPSLVEQLEALLASIEED